MANYERISTQKARLGSIERHGFGSAGAATAILEKFKGGAGGGAGGGDTATGIIKALGKIGTDILRIVERGKTMRTQIRHRSRILIARDREGTLRFIAGREADVKEAKIAVDMAVAKYSGRTKVIIGAGTVASGLLFSIAGSYYIVKAAQARARRAKVQ